MAYITEFDPKNHIAFAKSLNEKSMMLDAMDFYNNRKFYDQAGMEMCPEYQAYQAHLTAANEIYKYNKKLYKEIYAEATAWKNAAIELQGDLDECVWIVDDGYGPEFNPFYGEAVNIETYEDIIDIISTNGTRKRFKVLEIEKGLGAIRIKSYNNTCLYLRLV